MYINIYQNRESDRSHTTKKIGTIVRRIRRLQSVFCDTNNKQMNELVINK